MPSQDIVLGLYYMTRDRVNAKGEGMRSPTAAEVLRALPRRHSHVHARVKVRIIEHDNDG